MAVARPSRKSDATAQTISQIGRHGTNHLANPTPWHRPSRKSDSVAQAISQIGRRGTNHLANPTGWQKPALQSQESDAMAQTITQIGRDGAIASDLRDIGAPFLPRRPICVMGGPVSAIPSDLRDGEGAPVPYRPICVMEGVCMTGTLERLGIRKGRFRARRLVADYRSIQNPATSQSFIRPFRSARARSMRFFGQGEST